MPLVHISPYWGSDLTASDDDTCGDDLSTIMLAPSTIATTYTRDSDSDFDYMDDDSTASETDYSDRSYLSDSTEQDTASESDEEEISALYTSYHQIWETESTSYEEHTDPTTNTDTTLNDSTHQDDRSHLCDQGQAITTSTGSVQTCTTPVNLPHEQPPFTVDISTSQPSSTTSIIDKADTTYTIKETHTAFVESNDQVMGKESGVNSGITGARHLLGNTGSAHCEQTFAQEIARNSNDEQAPRQHVPSEQPSSENSRRTMSSFDLRIIFDDGTYMEIKFQLDSPGGRDWLEIIREWLVIVERNV